MYKELSAENKKAFRKDFIIEFLLIVLKIVGFLAGLALIVFLAGLCVYNPWFILVIVAIVVLLLIIKTAKNNAVYRFQTRDRARESMEQAAERIKSYETSLKRWKNTMASETHSEKEIENEIHHCKTCLEYWEGRYAEALVTYVAKGGKLDVE